jgi:FtsP/CotA-like multicopper oxidase with cupredoxin domain
VVRFPGTNVTYKPFTQTFQRPKILGFDSIHVEDAIDYSKHGIVKPTNTDPGGAQELFPYPGSPEPSARVGSDAVYHGIAPEYSRHNPTHKVANENNGEDPLDPEPGDCQHRTPAYPWDRFDDPGNPETRNLEPWTRPDTRNGEVHYALEIRNSRHEWAPGVVTDILAYRDAGVSPPTEGVAQDPDPLTGLSPTGNFPAPTILARQGQPCVVRVENQIEFRGSGAGPHGQPECSVHLHGDHTPAHSDGYPDFYILPDEKRDYYYPNIGPREHAEPVTETGLSPWEIAEKGNIGPYSLSDLPTTMWYHEHGMDITGFLVSQGLAGFYLIQDDHEVSMTTPDAEGKRKLPSFYGPQDLPMAIMDQIIDLKEETLPYNFFDHNGRVGNVFSVNGKLQPYVNVGKGKYRFRFLNASNARIYQLALAPENKSKLDFVQIGQDTWELNTAVARSDFPLNMAQRVDVIVDFSGFEDGDVIWLNNVMQQKDGRKPRGINFKKPTPLVKFIVDASLPMEEVTVEAGDLIRCFTEIQDEEVLATRYFTFTRRNGAWQINNQFFSPRTTNATPILNSAERWVFENKSGGWRHPIHIHLEGHEIQKYNGIPKRLRDGTINPRFPPGYVNNVDVSVLEANGKTEFLMKFRTFTGPFVFHCHNLEHEDMRMMHVFDPRPAGEPSLNNGRRAHSSTVSVDGVATYSEVSGMVQDEQPEPVGFGPVFFEREGDEELLNDRNVGFPATDFPRPPTGQILPGPPGEDAPDNHDD